MNNNQNNPNKNNKLKIVIPIIVVALILVVWIVKNNKENTTENVKLTDKNSAENQINDDSSKFALNVTSNLDMEQLKSYGLPIIIDFGADSCIPCQEMAPVLKELNESLQGKAIIKFADVRKYPDLAKDFPVKLIPTQFFFDKDGNPYSPSDSESLQLIKYNKNDTNEHAYTAHEGGITKEEMLAVLKKMGVEGIDNLLQNNTTKNEDVNNNNRCTCGGY